MRILSLHNSYLIGGGEDVSTNMEVKTMESNGHEVITYREHNSKISEMSKLSVAFRTVWSQYSYKHVKKLLSENKVDVMHVQNFLPLISPSVYYAARSLNVPVVQAVRNYRFMCTNALLYREGKICELCVHKKIPFPSFVHKCYRNNFSANFTVGTMLSVHNIVDSWRLVDRFACISNFVKEKMIQAGFDAAKLYVKPNFVYPDPGVETTKENYIVFVGRVNEEKGIFTLINSMGLVKNKSVQLKVVGEGDDEIMAQLKELSAGKNVEFLGKKPLAETYDIMGKAKVLVIPSLWHEPFGRAVVEAYAKATPVIGARVGGIPELIAEGVTGYTFEAGNANDLAEKIDRIYSNEKATAEMGMNARNEYLTKYTAQVNYEMMMELYKSVMANQ